MNSNSNGNSVNGGHDVGLSMNSKLDNANIYKQEGNDLYKQKVYKLAISKYHRALLYIKGIESSKQTVAKMFGGDTSSSDEMPDAVKFEVISLKINIYNNLSACLLNCDEPNYGKVVSYCDQVIELDPSNIKAIYRKGVAQYYLNQFENSLKTLNLAKNLPTGLTDPNIKKYITLCKDGLLQENEKMKKVYQNMFSNS